MSVNCGALPENLLESELFGHEKGVFTSADTLPGNVRELENVIERAVALETGESIQKSSLPEEIFGAIPQI